MEDSVLLNKLVLDILKKFTTIYETQRFVTLFTTAQHCFTYAKPGELFHALLLYISVLSYCLGIGVPASTVPLGIKVCIHFRDYFALRSCRSSFVRPPNILRQYRSLSCPFFTRNSAPFFDFFNSGPNIFPSS